MLTEIRIYFEGDKALKPGFDQFLRELKETAKRQRCDFRLISANSGAEACGDFGRALRTRREAWNILLIDSECPDDGNLSKSLCEKHGWDKSRAESIFWMVEMMESWFHAHKEAVEKFYGQGFRRNVLKANTNVEEIPKADLKDGLQKATKDTSKGAYLDNKTTHGPKLLTLIDPGRVRKAAPNCERLFTELLKRLE